MIACLFKYIIFMHYSAPAAPDLHSLSSSRLTNDDFRRLLATPRATPTASTLPDAPEDADAQSAKTKSKQKEK